MAEIIFTMVTVKREKGPYNRYTGAYIIMASLQVLVNNLLVWQSSCASKQRPFKNSEYICPAACRCSASNQNIDKRLARKSAGRKLVWRARLRLVCVSVELV